MILFWLFEQLNFSHFLYSLATFFNLVADTHTYTYNIRKHNRPLEGQWFVKWGKRKSFS